MAEKSSFEDLRYKSGQFRCVQCGYQTTPSMFEWAKMDIGIEIVTCPECGSREIIDFDTRKQVNEVR